MKVIKWITRKEAAGYNAIHIKSRMGFFCEGLDWDDYIWTHNKELVPYLEAIRASVIENGIKISGFEHLLSDRNGIPLFNDNTVILFSANEFANLMAAVRSGKNKTQSYHNFLMN